MGGLYYVMINLNLGKESFHSFGSIEEFNGVVVPRPTTTTGGNAPLLLGPSPLPLVLPSRLNNTPPSLSLSLQILSLCFPSPEIYP